MQSRRHLLTQTKEVLQRQQPLLMHLPELHIQLLVHILRLAVTERVQLLPHHAQQRQRLRGHHSSLELRLHHLHRLLLLRHDGLLRLRLTPPPLPHPRQVRVAQQRDRALDRVQHRLLLRRHTTPHSRSQLSRHLRHRLLHRLRRLRGHRGLCHG